MSCWKRYVPHSISRQACPEEGSPKPKAIKLPKLAYQQSGIHGLLLVDCLQADILKAIHEIKSAYPLPKVVFQQHKRTRAHFVDHHQIRVQVSKRSFGQSHTLFIEGLHDLGIVVPVTHCTARTRIMSHEVGRGWLGQVGFSAYGRHPMAKVARAELRESPFPLETPPMVP